MSFVEKSTIAGEHNLFFSGYAGQIEAVLNIPAESNQTHLALLGHPHSLQGGTMSNKVVTTMARAFKDAGIPSIRFNFRGVGQSQGVYDAGIGESEDMLRIGQLWQEQFPGTRFLMAGFSFGSYVAYRCAAQSDAVDLLITIAPPVHHYDYQEFQNIPRHWHIIQGDADEVVPMQVVLDFAASFMPPLPVTRFAETGHFFHGNLLTLKDELSRIIQQK